MCHHKSLNFVHTWKYVFTQEVVRLIWIWLNSHVYFEVGPQGDKILEDQVAVRTLPGKLVNTASMYLQCLCIRALKVTGTTLKVKFPAQLLPAGVQEGGGREAHWAPGLLPQAVRCCRSWVHFLVGFSNMNLQAIFGFEDGVTLFTLESFLIKSFFSYLFSNSFFFRKVFALQWDVDSWNFKFFLQKLFSSPGISFQSRGSFLFSFPFESQSFLPTGIQWEGEAVPKGQGEGEGERLGSQCLAKVQTLGQKCSIIFSHRHGSHFLRLYLNQIWINLESTKMHVDPIGWSN